MSAAKYLDLNGVSRLWDKVKAYVAQAISGKANDNEVVHKSELTSEIDSEVIPETKANIDSLFN